MQITVVTLQSLKVNWIGLLWQLWSTKFKVFFSVQSSAFDTEDIRNDTVNHWVVLFCKLRVVEVF